MKRVIIDAKRSLGKISRHIYGHFAEHLGRCIYGGFYVGTDSPIPNIDGIRKDVIAAFKNAKVPNLRWPGGCFADEYHWMDGIGPKEQRPTMINNNWGGVTENNHFGTHEFMRLCELVGCEPYICGNVGSGTIQEMAQWVEYLNSDNISPMTELRRRNGQEKAWGVKYFGIGNESWGCGGQMRPEYYADVYRRYACYCRKYGEHKLYKIASGANDFNYHWTEVLMREASPYLDGLSLHYYTVPGAWARKGAATGFSIEEWFITMKKALGMDEIITRHSNIMDQYDPEKRVGLIVDEWGTWYDVEPGTNPGFLYQQNSVRDALVAGLTLNIFNCHCNRVHMANLAQAVNVLQAMVLTEGEKIVLTPTYHVLEMFKGHQDADLLDCQADMGVYEFNGTTIPQLSVSASRKEDRVSVTLCNLHHEQMADVELELKNVSKIMHIEGRVLAGTTFDQCNTFEDPNQVIPQPLSVKPTASGYFSVRLPARAVAVIALA